jgi:hypothetical protein
MTLSLFSVIVFVAEILLTTIATFCNFRPLNLTGYLKPLEDRRGCSSNQAGGSFCFRQPAWWKNKKCLGIASAQLFFSSPINGTNLWRINHLLLPWFNRMDSQLWIVRHPASLRKQRKFKSEGSLPVPVLVRRLQRCIRSAVLIPCWTKLKNLLLRKLN